MIRVTVASFVVIVIVSTTGTATVAAAVVVKAQVYRIHVIYFKANCIGIAVYSYFVIVVINTISCVVL